MRGAPHNRFSLFICRMRPRNSRSIFGRPTRCRDFQRQQALTPERCQRRILGQGQQIRPNPRYADQQRPVTPVQPQTRRRPPQGDGELMAEKEILGFEPASRLERVGNEHCKQMKDCKHHVE